MRAAAVAASLGALVLSVAVAGPSSADITDHYYADSDNASDPFIFECTVWPEGAGQCLVSTQDLNKPGIYPMANIRGMFSSDGITWTHKQITLTEADLGKAGTEHMWAPAVRRVYNGSNGPFPVEEYWLYTPNLDDPADHLSSRIYVSYSTSALSGYSFLDEIQGPPWGTPAGDDLYMSDPEVFADAPNWDRDNSEDWLIWANGDYGTCGTISMSKMTSPTSVVPFSDPETQKVTINGIDALGTCTDNNGVVHPFPYMEGASMFNFDHFEFYDFPNGTPGPYVMFVSAKPSVVPADCALDGQTKNTNQVIAYATSSNVNGPFEFQGVVSCGSTTEWTNQGTVTQVYTPGGKPRLVLVHHDGKALQNDTRNRQIHSECLFTDENGDFLTTMKSSDGAVDENGNLGWCMTAENPVALRSAFNGHFVQARNDGQLQTVPNPIGLWEQFDRIDTVFGVGRGTRPGVAYESRNTGKLVSSDSNEWNNIIADRSAEDTWERFEQVPLGDGTGRFGLRDHRYCWVGVMNDGHLQADNCNWQSVPTDLHYVFEEVELAE